MLGSTTFGPLEVKEAMTGAGLVPISVFPGTSVAIGFFSVRIYVRSVFRLYEKTTVVGSKKGVTCISLNRFPKIAATPPALFTSIDASLTLFMQRTTFPLTRFLDSVPGRHVLYIQLEEKK